MAGFCSWCLSPHPRRAYQRKTDEWSIRDCLRKGGSSLVLWRPLDRKVGLQQ